MSVADDAPGLSQPTRRRLALSRALSAPLRELMHLRGVRPNPGTGRPGRSGAGSQRDRPRRLSRLAAIKRQLISITERTRRSTTAAQSATGNSTSWSKCPTSSHGARLHPRGCDRWRRNPSRGPSPTSGCSPLPGCNTPITAPTSQRGCLDRPHRAFARRDAGRASLPSTTAEQRRSLVARTVRSDCLRPG
jgi:hypothetical protein